MRTAYIPGIPENGSVRKAQENPPQTADKTKNRPRSEAVLRTAGRREQRANHKRLRLPRRRRRTAERERADFLPSFEQFSHTALSVADAVNLSARRKAPLLLGKSDHFQVLAADRNLLARHRERNRMFGKSVHAFHAGHRQQFLLFQRKNIFCFRLLHITLYAFSAEICRINICRCSRSFFFRAVVPDCRRRAKAPMTPGSHSMIACPHERGFLVHIVLRRWFRFVFFSCFFLFCLPIQSNPFLSSCLPVAPLFSPLFLHRQN